MELLGISASDTLAAGIIPSVLMYFGKVGMAVDIKLSTLGYYGVGVERICLLERAER